MSLTVLLVSTVYICFVASKRISGLQKVLHRKLITRMYQRTEEPEVTSHLTRDVLKDTSVDPLRVLFDDMDVDNDGVLSFDEFIKFWDDMEDESPSGAALAKVRKAHEDEEEDLDAEYEGPVMKILSDSEKASSFIEESVELEKDLSSIFSRKVNKAEAKNTVTRDSQGCYIMRHCPVYQAAEDGEAFGGPFGSDPCKFFGEPKMQQLDWYQTKGSN